MFKEMCPKPISQHPGLATSLLTVTFYRYGPSVIIYSSNMFLRKQRQFGFSTLGQVKRRKPKKPEYAKLNKCALDPWFNGAEPAKVYVGQCLSGEVYFVCVVV